MKVTLNQTEIELPDGCTLMQALELQKISTSGIAVAVNHNVVPKSDYATHQLCNADDIIIIKAFYGG